jgi:hypothetical protein
MEIRKCDHAVSGGPCDMDFDVEGGEGNAHVGGMGRDARFARPQNRMHPVEAIYSRAPAVWRAFVARSRNVVEIIAARSLHEIAASRGHIAQLLRGAGENGAAKQRIASLDERVIGEIGIRHERADAHAALRCFFHLVQRQARDVDQPQRAFDILLHQIDQIGSAGDEFRARAVRDSAHRVGHVDRSGIIEIDHDWLIACSIAATIFG